MKKTPGAEKHSQYAIVSEREQEKNIYSLAFGHKMSKSSQPCGVMEKWEKIGVDRGRNKTFQYLSFHIIFPKLKFITHSKLLHLKCILENLVMEIKTNSKVNYLLVFLPPFLLSRYVNGLCTLHTGCQGLWGLGLPFKMWGGGDNRPLMLCS